MNKWGVSLKLLIQNFSNGKITLVEIASSVPNSNQILVQTTTSVLSAGTERATAEFSQRSLLGKALARPDLVKQVLRKVKNDGIIAAATASMARLDVPLPLGYSSAGIVLEVGSAVTGVAVGDRVACAGQGYASHGEAVVVPRNLFVKVPDGVADEAAAFATLGAIALQGVRVADLRLGERVAVIGLGLIGLITIQLLKAAGCQVVGSDVDAERLAFALELGADKVICAPDLSFETVREFTFGRGVDATIVTAATSSNDPTEKAGEISRHKGRVVFVGDVRMDIPRRIYYKKELDVRLSMSYGPGRYDPQYEEKGIDYPYAYIPFTEQRNMEVFLQLVCDGKVTPDKLITHRFMLNQAQDAYRLIKGEIGEPSLGVLFQYPAKIDIAKKVLVGKAAEIRMGAAALNLGVIGAGNYAKQVLIPQLKSQKANFIGIATATGISGRHTGEKFGFEYCTTDYRQVLADERINAVVVATRHNTHAQIAAEALKAGKHVFVEKPLAMNDEELGLIAQAADAASRHVVVGFNRRFAPLAAEAKKFFHGRSQPLCMVYRINAGFIPSDHWTQDNAVGGGRIIGEVCHFIDFLQFICGSEPETVYACGARSASIFPEENLSVTIGYKDGSVGSIHYFANGDKALAKEYIELFGEAKVFRIEDFRRGWATRSGRTRTIGVSQDKGQADLLKAFENAVIKGGQSPIPLNEAIISTYVSFRVEESLRSGTPLKL